MQKFAQLAHGLCMRVLTTNGHLDVVSYPVLPVLEVRQHNIEQLADLLNQILAPQVSDRLVLSLKLEIFVNLEVIVQLYAARDRRLE